MPDVLVDGAPGVTTFTPVQLLRLAALFARDPELADHPTTRPDDDPRGRSWAQLALSPHLQVWLIRWPAGTSTGWHDHGGSAGALTVVSGELTERTWSGGVAEQRLRAGDERAFGSSYRHDVLNLGEQDALSVHAYSPSLAQMTRYDLLDGRLRPAGVEQRAAW